MSETQVPVTGPGASSGNQAWLAELYRSQHDGMVRLAYVIVRDNEAANDIVHDAFVQLQRRPLVPERSEAFLRTVVINASRSHIRRRVTAQNTALPLPTAPTLSLRDDSLDAALSRLPSDWQVVLVLRYHCDLEDVAIADLLGIRRSTVRTRAHRALNALRKELHDE